MKRYEGLNEYHSTGTGGRAEYQEPDACKCGTCLQVRDCPIPAANATLTPAASRLCLLHPRVVPLPPTHSCVSPLSHPPTISLYHHPSQSITHPHTSSTTHNPLLSGYFNPSHFLCPYQLHFFFATPSSLLHAPSLRLLCRLHRRRRHHPHPSLPSNCFAAVECRHQSLPQASHTLHMDLGINPLKRWRLILSPSFLSFLLFLFSFLT